MPLTLYGLKTCDTCKKALANLEAAGTPAAFVDIRTGTDLAEKVPLWLAACDDATLINMRSTTWRGLDAADRSKAETDVAALLIANPTLIKRPVIEADGTVYVGWGKDVQAKLL